MRTAWHTVHGAGACSSYIKSISPKLGAITDDFFRLPNGGFLVSLMGSTEGEAEPLLQDI
jgi:hypothetical protein